MCVLRVVGLLVLLLCSSHQNTASAALSFIPLSTYSSVSSGDDRYGGTVYPDVTFPFGTTTVTNIYVSNNGYFSMGGTPQYASLSSFPSSSSYSVVAPFAADIDTSSTGYVRYSESFTNSQLSVVSEHIRSETDTSFYGQWMLVAEWNGVPLLQGTTSITNTFQGILISDGTSSYAVFIYDCSIMEWGGGVIGWQQSTTQYASHDASDDSDSNEVVCEYQTSSFTTLVYRLNSAALSFIPLSTYSSVSSGDDTSSTAVYPDVTFPFGTTTVTRIYVSNNGYISMGGTPQYASLSSFPSSNSYSVVAPFAADITTSSTGSVRYSESFTNSQLTVVSELIRSDTGTSFYGQWMLVAEWNEVPLLSQSSSTTNSFQGILISDGSSSYAVFIYDCTNMEWGGGVIGWQQSTTRYASHSASRQSSSNEAVCDYQSSSFTSLVYRVDSAESCSLSEFECDNDRCVTSSDRCDGNNDCGDNSDEEGCDSCSSSAFECDNGRCVTSSDRCDGNNDCGDNSDEEGCGNCYSYQFSCDNGDCVADSYRCDNFDDCGDNSDEDGCVNVGLAVGLSVGISFLFFCVGIPICIVVCAVYASNKRRHPTVRTHVVATTPSGGTTVVTTNQATATSVPIAQPPLQQPAYKDAQFSSQVAPPSYTAATAFPTYTGPPPQPYPQQYPPDQAYPISGYQLPAHIPAEPLPYPVEYPTYPPTAPIPQQAFPLPNQAVQQPNAGSGNVSNAGYLLQQ